MKSIRVLSMFIVLGISFPVTSFTQETDSAFISNYKKFRAFVDPLPGKYDIYLVYNGPSSKMRINDIEKEMKEAYHFLRRKTTVKNTADFNIGVIVKEMRVEEPVSKMTAGGAGKNVATNSNGYIQPYSLTMHILVHANGKVIEFPICTGKQFEKEQALYANSNGVLQKLPIGKYDIKTALVKVLQGYKNHYVDRVN